MLLEVVGHDGQADLSEPNDEARQEHKHEAELKLILSSNLKDWNISENFIAEKNLGHAPWEFGYAVGATPPAAQPRQRPGRAPFASRNSWPESRPTAAWETPGTLSLA